MTSFVCRAALACWLPVTAALAGRPIPIGFDAGIGGKPFACDAT